MGEQLELAVNVESIDLIKANFVDLEKMVSAVNEITGTHQTDLIQIHATVLRLKTNIDIVQNAILMLGTEIERTTELTANVVNALPI